MGHDAKALGDLSRLCIHTVTTKPWALEEAVGKYSKAGVRGITLWRDAYAGRSLPDVRRMLADSGLTAVSVCRGGFFPGANASDREKACDDNRRALDEAAELGAPHVVLVCGALPGQPLAVSRAQIRDGIEAVLPHAEKLGVKLAIEPLHPMYAADRSAINTMEQANDLAECFDTPSVGVAIDVYHLWWDDKLKAEIERCGRKGNILAFHVCDWLSPFSDMLNDRGLMGEGCIPIREIRSWVEQAGFSGWNEVEIFSKRHWARNQDEFLADITDSYLKHV